MADGSLSNQSSVAGCSRAATVFIYPIGLKTSKRKCYFVAAAAAAAAATGAVRYSRRV